MGTTVDKLNKLKVTKEAIRVAINNKGGILTTSDTFASYATAIDNIQSGSENESITITQNGTYTAPEGVGYSPITVNVPQVAKSGTIKNLLDNTKSAQYLFYNYKGTNIDNLISYSDTSNVITMSYMFQYCNNLITIPQLDTSSCAHMNYMFVECMELENIPQFDTSACIEMPGMFKYCIKLTTIPQFDTGACLNMASMFHNCSSLTSIPQLDTSNVTNMYSMFSNCQKLQNIPKINTIACESMNEMFYNCFKLTSIDLTHMKPTSAYNISKFATNCYSLKKLIIRNMDTIPLLNSDSFIYCYHFYGTTDATYNPEGLKDGRIYVPDDKVDELKVATNWSVFADIIVPLSTLVEE